MKALIAIAVLVAASGTCAAQDVTPQEADMLGKMRQSYQKQTGRKLSAEQEREFLTRWREASANRDRMMARMGAMAGAPGMATPAAPLAAAAPAPAQPAITDQALLQQLAAHGEGKGQTSIERLRDGLRIGGASFLDPEGKINTYAYDVLTGDISYSIGSGDSATYKYMRAGSGADPVPFATARQTGDGWQVTTVTGKMLNGDTVIPLARGLLVARAGSVFLFEPGKAVRSAVVPDGWNMAQFQRGNVGATRYVMLERSTPPNQAAGGVGALIGSFKSLGAAAGLARKEDYALMQLETGKLHLLNVQSSGKSRNVMSNCRRRSALVNECASMNSFESLYTDTGRNFGHYFWKADWYATPAGPLAVTMENGVADVFVLDLDSGKKVNVFHRALGITSMDSVQSPDGRVAINAKWMFDDHKVDDASKFLAETAPVAAQ